MGLDELRLAHKMTDSNHLMAVCLAVAASLALFALLTADGSTVRAQTDASPTPVGGGPVVVWETAIPEDWPEGQASHIIFTFEAFSADGGALTFALKETDDTAKFSLIPAGVNDAGNYLAQLQLKAVETLDYETQDTYLIGVVVSTEGGASTEMLLRLRITDVDEGVVSPSPTASASPTPIATPTDPCFEAISGEVNIVRSWDSSCLSENRPDDGRAGDYYARFFTFTIDEAATISVMVTSEIDTYMYLMKGSAKDGVIEEENDDFIQYVNLNAGIEDYALDAGSYTIEATAYDVEKSGNFRLVVSGLPDAGEPQADCSTGGAVSNAASNSDMVADCETLLGLRDALAGTTLLDWATDTPIEDWDGVTVSGSPKRVTEVALDESGLNGEVPGGLGQLTALTVLSLSGNSLRGSIPEELGSLSNLTALSIDDNQLTGSIPVDLGDLANLETLSLNDNMLSGDIPSELGGLSKLKKLLLANNRLTGDIPAGLGDLANLEELELSGNTLSGCIAPALQDVADNDLSDTGLDACASGACSTGSAVASPEDNAGLVSDCNALLAARDRLAGRASLNWSASVLIEDWEGVRVSGSTKRVVHLALDQKGLSGRIPAELGMLSHLSLLQLTDNELKGAIPTELGNLSKLELLILTENELSGEIPSELRGLSSLSELSLTGNDLTGAIPAEVGDITNLRSLYLDDNRLSGAIPGELGSLHKLVFLKLNDNALTGPIPPEIGDISTLERLSLDNNKLTGSIPPELGRISTLKVLYLDKNELTGEIPRELGDLPNLEVLSLSHNQLGGEIPAELANIPTLGTLSLYNNLFTGCIPKELKRIQANDLGSLDLPFCEEGMCSAGTAVENPNANRGLTSDCQALVAALDTLRGSVSLDWSTEISIEEWEGVVISDSPRRVIELDLSVKSLDGTIPPELGNITKLKILSLSGNALTGEIPSRLAKLSSLETLSLDDNQLSGQIPPDLVRLTNLKELHLSGNQFTGCIPDGLEDVEDNDLDTFDNLPLCGEVDCSSGTAVDEPGSNEGLVADCELLLELRDELAGRAFLNWSPHIAVNTWDGVTVGGSTKRVTRIELDDQGLSGEIPTKLGRLANLEVLSLADNQLSGEIPSELGGLSELTTLSLANNQLSGEISAELAVLSNLEELKLAGNNLSGCIPEAFEDITTNDLEELGLDYCVAGECSSGTAVEDPGDNPGLVVDCDALLAARDTLKGDGILNWSADVAIGEWYGVTVGGSPKRVTELELGPSRLNGQVAPELGSLSKLSVLSLSDNRLSGEIPSELGGLTGLEELSLSENRLTGAIPSSLGNLTALERLSLSDNRLSGEIPSQLGSLVNLDRLSLSENQLSGAIPTELGSLIALSNLSLNNNRLTGGIPSEFGSLVEVRYLRLSDNQLSGQIPSELGTLSNLRYLYLSRNQLSGEIPTELKDLVNLRYLHLSDNELTGDIPPELGSLSNLVQLYLTRNQLTGEIPSELGNLENLVHLFLSGNQLSGCIPEELRDVANNDLSLLNLPDCEAATGLITIPRGLGAESEKM